MVVPAIVTNGKNVSLSLTTGRHDNRLSSFVVPIDQALAPCPEVGCCAVFELVSRALCIGLCICLFGTYGF